MRTDPDNVRNLAADPAHTGTRQKLRGELKAWMRETADPRAKNPDDDRWDKYPYFGGKAQ